MKFTILLMGVALTINSGCRSVATGQDQADAASEIYILAEKIGNLREQFAELKDFDSEATLSWIVWHPEKSVNYRIIYRSDGCIIWISFGAHKDMVPTNSPDIYQYLEGKRLYTFAVAYTENSDLRAAIYELVEDRIQGLE